MPPLPSHTGILSTPLIFNFNNTLLFFQFSNARYLLFLFYFPFIAIIAAYLVYVSAIASGAGLTGNVDQELETKESAEF